MTYPQNPRFRLYSFVAHHYLSELQRGLQTAHVVSDLSRVYSAPSVPGEIYKGWADADKTIVILGASNHFGVLECHARLFTYGEQLNLPVALFREDEQSMNCMATACGIIVPEDLYDVTWVPNHQNAVGEDGFFGMWAWTDGSGYSRFYDQRTPQGQFVAFLKSYKLA